MVYQTYRTCDYSNCYDNPTPLEEKPSYFRPYGLGTWGIGANWIAIPGTFENCTTYNSYGPDASPSVCRAHLTPAALILARIIGVAHLVFDILGYIPGIQFMSGLARIGFTAVILTPAFCLLGCSGGLTRNYIPRLKALVLGQLARGALEMIPFGFIANIILDVVATPINLIQLNPFGSIVLTT